jgi:hypothetical protein
MPRDLHTLPRLSDRWSHLYLEHGRLQKTKEGLGFVDPQGGLTAIPLDQFAVPTRVGGEPQHGNLGRRGVPGGFLRIRPRSSPTDLSSELLIPRSKIL